MTTTSNTDQPTSCTMLTRVGRYDRRPPNRPRSNTIAGAPVCAPGTAAAASISAPSTVPTTTAAPAATNDNRGTPFGARTYNAPTGPSNETPRLAQRPTWSNQPSTF